MKIGDSSFLFNANSSSHFVYSLQRSNQNGDIAELILPGCSQETTAHRPNSDQQVN